MWCGRPIHRLQTCDHTNRTKAVSIHISWLYQGAISNAVVRSKNSKDISAGVGLIPLLFQAPPSLEWLQGINLIIPVPPNPTRLRAFGFDPVCELSSFLGRLFQIPVEHRLVHRRGAGAQKEGSRVQRIESAKQMYELGRLPNHLKGTTVLLMDDVRTSGATTDTLSKMLLEAGIADVRIWVFSGSAHTPDE